MGTSEPLPRLPDEERSRLEALLEGVEFTQISSPEEGSLISFQAFVADAIGSVPPLSSRGELHLYGGDATEHKADLESVGKVAQAWQRAVTVTGAGLVGERGIRGRISEDISKRTRLLLTASPAPGSILLKIEPESLPMHEVEPAGQQALSDDFTARPLCDQASEALLAVLKSGSLPLEDMDEELSGRLHKLGPRAASGIRRLLRTLHESDITVSASWVEPMYAARQARVTPAVAQAMSSVIDGKGLAELEDTLTGELLTISESQRWVLQVGDDRVQVDASELPRSQKNLWKLHEMVDMDVRIAIQERGDGTLKRQYRAVAIRTAGFRVPTTPSIASEVMKPSGSQGAVSEGNERSIEGGQSSSTDERK